MTQDGFNKLKSELEHLKNSERPSVIKAIAEAREHAIFQKMLSTTPQEKKTKFYRRKNFRT